RNLTTSQVLVENGGVMKIAVGRSINNSDIRITGSAGVLGSLTAAEWIAGGNSDDLVAKNIGSLTIKGAPSLDTAPSASFLPGDFSKVNVRTFLNAGVGPAIGSF